MFVDGELPRSNLCAQCGSVTPNVIHCSVECERPHTKGRGFLATVLLGLALTYWAFGALNREYRNTEVYGEELLVDAPLALCNKCIADLRTGKLKLRDLLCREPLYAQLLNEYPVANIAVSSQVIPN